MKPHLLALAALLATHANAAGPPAKSADAALREVAGNAEFLRSLPKRFGTLVRIDAKGHRVTVRLDGDNADSEWAVLADAEVKIDGWWGRLDQFVPGERVWAWLKTDRKNKPVAIAMLADDLSQQDIHGQGVTVKANVGGKLVVTPEKGPDRSFDAAKPVPFAVGTKVFVRGMGSEAALVVDAAGFEARRAAQREALRKRWLSDGLPGGVSFAHVFSGELDLMLDHEAIRWGRSLKRGDKVTLAADPPIDAVVKAVQPWRERTQVRLVVRPAHMADLAAGQRLHLKIPAPPSSVEQDRLPPDLGRPRSREERIDWFLASVYCTCGVRGDTCTGMFYTLASCNPNGCGKPNEMRKRLAKLIDAGLSDRQILEKLLAAEGPGLLQPHLLP